MASDSALAKALNEFFSRDDLPDVFLGMAHSLARNILVPLAVTILAIGGSVHIIKRSLRYIAPPSPPERYQEAKQWYRQGMVQEALQEWEDLGTFAPAYLSRACHELFVSKDHQKALDILGSALTLNLHKSMNKDVEDLRLDARAMANGNHVMVNLSAAIAMEDYLGIHA